MMCSRMLPGHASCFRSKPLFSLVDRRLFSAAVSGSVSVPAPPSDASVSFFESVLGKDNVIGEAGPEFTTDWTSQFEGGGPGVRSVVLRPGSTEEVSAILAHCHDNDVAVVPQGGKTGLVGGAVPVAGGGEVVLNTSRLRKVRSFCETSGVLVCEAGCVLEELDHIVAGHGFMMPLDLGAKGTCQIGGNAATNAGGLRLVRYGSMHENVLGVEAVLADGTVLDLLNTMRKDNTGLPLKHLFIGSEGTLGVITAVSVLARPRPAATNVAWLACQDYEAVQNVFRRSRSMLAEILSAIELVDRASLEVALARLPAARSPLGDGGGAAGDYPFFMLVETAGSDGSHDSEKLDAFLTRLMEDEDVVDGVVAQDTAQAAAMWGIREGVNWSMAQTGYVFKYDFAIPLSDLYALVDEVREKFRAQGFAVAGGDAVEGEIMVVGYGHIGDGNLHLNICTPGTFTEDPAVKAVLEPMVYEWTAARGGSISAEHGVGQLKKKYLGLGKSDEVMGVMRQVKQLLDPKNILNPAKVIDV